VAARGFQVPRGLPSGPGPVRVLENKHLLLPPLRGLPEIFPRPGLKIGSPRHQQDALIQAAKRPSHPRGHRERRQRVPLPDGPRPELLHFLRRHRVGDRPASLPRLILLAPQLLENDPGFQRPRPLPDLGLQLRRIQQRVPRLPPPCGQRPQQPSLHLLQRRLARQVFELMGILFQVVQLHPLPPPRLRLDLPVTLPRQPVRPLQSGILQQRLDHLVSSLPQGALGVEQPRLVGVGLRGQHRPPGNLAVLQQRHQRLAGQARRHGRLGKLQQGRQEIHRAHQFLAHPGTKAARPTHQQRHLGPRLEAGDFAPRKLRPVVAHENDQGVFFQTAPPQNPQHLAHHLVQPVHAGEIVRRLLPKLGRVPAHKGKHGRRTGLDLHLRAAPEVAREGHMRIKQVHIKKKRGLPGLAEKTLA